MSDWTEGRLSSYFAYHSPDFLYRSATIDFIYKGLPGFAFGRFYSVHGFGPDDTEIFYISILAGVGDCRVLSLSDRRYSLNPLSQTRID